MGVSLQLSFMACSSVEKRWMGVSLQLSFMAWSSVKEKMDDDLSNFGSERIIYGRKKQYGQYLLGTVDFLCMVLDVEITHPGSTSGYLFLIKEEVHSTCEVVSF
jgi:hypothetical protein